MKVDVSDISSSNSIPPQGCISPIQYDLHPSTVPELEGFSIGLSARFGVWKSRAVQLLLAVAIAVTSLEEVRQSPAAHCHVVCRVQHAQEVLTS